MSNNELFVVHSWCVCVGLSTGGEDSPALFDLGGAACFGPTLLFWYRSSVTSGLPQEWLSDGEWGLNRDAVPFCAGLRDGGLLREGQWETKVFKVLG
jgi:hypothetical protein